MSNLLDDESVAMRVQNWLTARGRSVAGLYSSRILALVPMAFEVFGKRCAAMKDYEGMQKSFDITVAAGQYDTSALASIILNPLRAIVTIPGASTRPAIYRQSVEDLHGSVLATGASEPLYYSQSGAVLIFRNNADGLTTTLNANGTLWANFIPATYAEIPAQDDQAFIETLGELLTSQGEARTEAIEATSVGRA